MANVRVTIEPESPEAGAPVELETLDITTALAVADINILERGSAAIRQGERLLARLVKRGDGQSTYWEVERQIPAQ